MSKSDDTAPLLGSGEYAAVNAPYPADGLDSKAAGAAGTAEPSAAARMRFTVFNLGNTIMGGGILSLPYAMKVRTRARAQRARPQRTRPQRARGVRQLTDADASPSPPWRARHSSRAWRWA